MRTLRWLRWAAAIATVLIAMPAFAYKIQIAEHTTLNIDYLLQVQAQFAEKGAPDGTAWSKDFFVRRSRILLFGDLWKNISFFFETDQANWGKGGKWDAAFFVQDAYVTFKVVEAFQVDVGMILLPFSRANLQGAIGLNALDYHLNLIKFVPGSHHVWRDMGIQLRGTAANKKFSYRLGVFNGAQGQSLQKDAAGAVVKDAAGKDVLKSNPEDWPRFAGHVRYSILGDDTAFFFKGLHFATAPIVSIGAGFDYQHAAVMDRPADLDKDRNVVKKATVTHALAFSADVYADVPIGKNQEFVLQAGFFWYDHGNDLVYAKDGTRSVVAAKSSGLGIMTEVGYRYDFVEPVFCADWFHGKRDDNDILDLRGGVNFWIRNHNASIKAEFSGTKMGNLDKAKWGKAFTTQAQLFF
ncbi:MAG TPA: porin [Myxococcota bacterium]|nr:porin [Myxococcota bacterium]